VSRRRSWSINNPTGRWQGAFRVVWLDLVLLRYAAEVNMVDSYAVTWLDQFKSVRNRGCVDYRSDFVPWGMEKTRVPVPSTYPDLARSAWLVEYLDSVIETTTEIKLLRRIGRVSVTGRGPSAADYYDCLGGLEVRLGRGSLPVA
jgi:adenylosuccinate synthase